MKKLFSLLLCSSFVCAADNPPLGASTQTQQLYGSSGQYQGNSIKNGNNTQYNAKNGQYQGNAVTNGNQTQYYNADGKYVGRTQNNQ